MFARVSRTRYSLLTVSLLVVLFVLAGTRVLSQKSVASAASTSTLAIIVPGKARLDEQFTVKVVATGVRNLGGFQSALNFDANHLLVDHASVTEALKGPNRDLLPLGPVLRDGSVVIGAVTCPVAQCVSARYKESARDRSGIHGRVELAEIVFVAKAPGRLELKLDKVQLVDPQGNPIPVSSVNATVDIIE